MLAITIGFILFAGVFQWVLFGWNTISSDQMFYSISLELFSEQLWQGDWFPRILHEADGGRSSPVFLVYGPLPFYINATLYPLLSGFLNQLDMYFLAMTLAMLLASFAHYKWMREYFSTLQSAWITCWFAVTPFKLITLYMRSNLAYFFTLTCLICMLLFTERMLKGKPYAWFGIVFSICALLLTHVPSVFMVGWLPFIYVFIRQKCKGEAYLAHLRNLLFAYACAGVLATFFWLPGLVNASWLSLNVATDIALVFSHEYLWWSLPLLVVAVVFSACTLRQPSAQHQPLLWTAFVSMLVALFFLTPVSIWLWQHVIFLQWIQMPFRFFILFDVWFGLLSMVALSYVHTKRFWPLLVAALVLGYVATLVRNMPYPASEQVSVAREHHIIAPIHDAFKTVYTPQDIYHVKHRLKSVGRPLLEGPLDAKMSTRKHAVSQWGINLDSNEASQYTLNKYYLPNMQLAHQHTGKLVELTPNAQGLTQFEMPKGKYQLMLSYQTLPMQKEANMISLLALFGLGVGLMLRRSINRRASGLR